MSSAPRWTNRELTSFRYSLELHTNIIHYMTNNEDITRKTYEQRVDIRRQYIYYKQDLEDLLRLGTDLNPEQINKMNNLLSSLIIRMNNFETIHSTLCQIERNERIINGTGTS